MKGHNIKIFYGAWTHSDAVVMVFMLLLKVELIIASGRFTDKGHVVFIDIRDLFQLVTII